MDNIKKYSIILVALIIAFLAGKFFAPKHVEIKEVEKIVYKEQVKKDEDRAVHVEIKETILPDGTRLVQTISDERTNTKEESTREIESNKSRTSISNSLQPQWSIGLYTDRQEALATIDRRILGGLFIGIYGHSKLSKPDPRVGIGLRLEL